MEVEVLRFPNPFPYSETNSYLINRCLLIDTGVYTNNSVELIEKFLKERNLDFSIDLVITHPHVDHFGLAYLFEEVYAHKHACNRLKDCAKNYFKLCINHFEMAGVPKVLIDELVKRVTNTYMSLAKPCNRCKDIGDKIKIGDEVFEVLHTPGHTYCHISLYHKESGSLFCGDTVLERTVPTPLIEPIDENSRHPVLEQYISTVKRLYELDIAKVYPGHGDFKSDFKKILRWYLDRWMNKSIEIWRRANNSTPFEVVEEIYGVNRIIFLTTSEVLAHLDFLHLNDFVEVYDGRYRRCGDLNELVDFWNDIKFSLSESGR